MEQLIADQEIRVPPFFCPLESLIHPDVGIIEEQSIAWIDSFHFCDEVQRAWLIGTNCAEFYARVTPHAVMANLQKVVNFNYWAFAFDDMKCDEGPLSTRPGEFIALGAKLIRILETPALDNPDPDPLIAALQGVAQLYRECATPVQIRRWIDGFRGWILGVAWQIQNRASGHMPALDEYVCMRLNSAAGPLTVSHIEIANGSEVSAVEMDAVAVRALTEVACMIAAWDNDFVSFRKEILKGQTSQNVITVIANQKGCSLQQAVTEAFGMRDRMMCLFLKLQDRIRPKAGSALRAYIDSLGYLLRGNLEWSFQVPRYNSLGDTSKPPGSRAKFFPGWAETPIDDSLSPLPLPSVAWWWNYINS